MQHVLEVKKEEFRDVSGPDETHILRANFIQMSMVMGSHPVHDIWNSPRISSHMISTVERYPKTPILNYLSTKFKVLSNTVLKTL